MEWKINRERIPVTERILDETQEQGVELDYVLPDYDPEIFRIIRCEMQPAILEYQLQETRLSYELQVDLRILYCGSDSHRLQCVTQTMHYTKTLDLPEKPENPAVLLQAKADYANCRAVSRRRLDVRGAVSVRVQITGERMQEVISDVFGMQVQCQKQTIAYASQKQRAVKTISLSEDIERNAAKAPIQSILRCTGRTGGTIHHCRKICRTWRSACVAPLLQHIRGANRTGIHAIHAAVQPNHRHGAD